MYQFLHNYRATTHCTTGVAPPIALFGRPIRVKLPNPVVMPSGESPTRKRDAKQKLRIKSQAKTRRAVKDCHIQVGDTERVRQPKREKLSTPYHPTPLTVTNKHHSMLTAEITDQKVIHHVIHLTSKSFWLMTQPHSEPFSHMRERQLTWKLIAALLLVFQSQSRSPQTDQWTPIEMLRS